MVAYILIQVRIRHLPLRLSVQEPTVRILGIRFCIIFVSPVPYVYYVTSCISPFFVICVRFFSPLFFFPFPFFHLMLLFFCIIVCSLFLSLSFIFALDGIFVLEFDCDFYSNSGTNQAPSAPTVSVATNRTFFGIHFCIIFVTPVPYIYYVPYFVLTIFWYLRALFFP